MATTPLSPIQRALSLGLAAFTALYLACFGAAVPSFIDEAFTFNLATDRSLAHMLAALGDGADGASPLFAVFVFLWEKIFGSSEASLRAAGGLFIVLFVWHTGSQLLRRFAPGAVALAILLVLANPEVIFHAAQARFYGFVLCAFSLAFWSTVALLEDPAPSRRRCWMHAAACGLLWLSHPFGMIYGALLALLYAAFALRGGTFSWRAAASFLGGPICFLPWLPIFLVQRQVHPIFPADAQVPGWQKYWEFAFLSGPVFCAVSVLALLVLVASRSVAQRQLAVVACAFLVLLNAAVAVLDATGIIRIYLMQAERYVLVSAIAFAAIFAATIDVLGRGVPRWRGLPHGAAALLLLWQMSGVWRGWFAYKSSREPYLAQVARDARERGMELVCENQADAFLLATRTDAGVVKYLLADDYHSRTHMQRLQRHYPRPLPITPTEARSFDRDFMLIRPNREARIMHIQPPKPAVISARD